VPSAPAGVDPETRPPFPADELRALRRILADALAETAR
jgi:hypothetical protein